jgi:hypothetical protein
VPAKVNNNFACYGHELVVLFQEFGGLPQDSLFAQVLLISFQPSLGVFSSSKNHISGKIEQA